MPRAPAPADQPPSTSNHSIAVTSYVLPVRPIPRNALAQRPRSVYRTAAVPPPSRAMPSTASFISRHSTRSFQIGRACSGGPAAHHAPYLRVRREQAAHRIHIAPVERLHVLPHHILLL